MSGEQTRARLLEVAASLFALDGYAGVSLANIAGAAGLTAPAIYNHFASKDELFIETVCAMFDEIAGAFAEAAAPKGPWGDRVARIMRTASEVYREDAVLQRLGAVARLKMAFEPEKYHRIADANQQVREVFRAIIADAHEAGELPEGIDLEITGDLLCSLIMTGISAETNERPSQLEFDELVKAFKVLLGQDPFFTPDAIVKPEPETSSQPEYTT